MFVQRWKYPTFIALTALVLGVFLLQSPIKVTAQSEPLCGQYIRHETEQAGFGSWISLFFLTEKGPMGISEPPFEEGYYRLYDVVTVSWTSTYFDGSPIDKHINSWSKYEKINSLQDCAPEAPNLEPTTAACTTLRGVVTPEKVSCLYGPGFMYLYYYGMRQGATQDIIGRNDLGTWVLTRSRGDTKTCWVKADLMKISDDVMCLPPIHPDNFRLPRTTYYGPLTGVSASRSGNTVNVSWDKLTLRADLDSLQTPYVVEAWVCRDGKFFFDPAGSKTTSVSIVDEPGCSEPSHGRVMAAEKHGYTQSVEIPWPALAAPPTSIPTPEPPAEPKQPPMCGLLTGSTVPSGMTANLISVLVPCGSNEPVLVESLRGMGSEGVFCFEQPIIESVEQISSTAGIISRKLVSWANDVKKADSCSALGLKDAVLQVQDGLMIRSIQWSHPPKSFELVDLTLNVEATGKNVVGNPYKVDITFMNDVAGEDFTLRFNMQDESRKHLSQPVLKEGKSQIVIKDLFFPAAYDGAILISIQPTSGNNTIEGHILESIVVQTSADNAGVCYSAAVHVDNPLNPNLQKMSQNIEVSMLCQGNPTCYAKKAADSFSPESLLKPLVNQIKTPVAEAIGNILNLRKYMQLTFDVLKCKDFVVEYYKQLMHKANISGLNISGFLTASPVYPMVVNAQGQRTGFLSDGTLVAENPGAYALETSGTHIILLPADEIGKLTVTGYDHGTMNLYVILADKEKTLDRTYLDIPVQPGVEMTYSPDDPKQNLRVSLNGSVTNYQPQEPISNNFWGDKLPIILLCVSAVCILLLGIAAVFLGKYILNKIAK